MADASLQQALGQQQTLTPQMRRSLDILQANSMELTQLIQQAMEMNPMLEEISPEPEEVDEYENESPEADELGHLNETDDDYREREIESRASMSDDEEARRQHYYDSIVAPETLPQFLSEQVQQSIVPEPVKEVAHLLIGNLTERGYHDVPPMQLAAQHGIKPVVLKQAINLLHSLDPAGIAADNLRESLLIQLRRKKLQDTLAYKIIDHHLDALARRHITQIAKALHTSPENITDAAEFIAKNLNPDPASSFQGSNNPHVIPDVVIRKDDDGNYYAELTSDTVPQLRISDYYKNLLGKLGSDKKALEYIRENIRDGRSIIASVNLRQETILNIANSIISRQKAFLQFGQSKLAPMKMAEIGDELGMHATTISRAVAGKFIKTPWGIMEMRNFFATGYQTQGGEELSNAAVRDALQSLIASENTSKPLSDESLMKALASQGIEISRRTVAKYRDQLHILPSHLRKR